MTSALIHPPQSPAELRSELENISQLEGEIPLEDEGFFRIRFFIDETRIELALHLGENKRGDTEWARIMHKKNEICSGMPLKQYVGQLDGLTQYFSYALSDQQSDTNQLVVSEMEVSRMYELLDSCLPRMREVLKKGKKLCTSAIALLFFQPTPKELFSSGLLHLQYENLVIEKLIVEFEEESHRHKDIPSAVTALSKVIDVLKNLLRSRNNAIASGKRILNQIGI